MTLVSHATASRARGIRCLLALLIAVPFPAASQMPSPDRPSPATRAATTSQEPEIGASRSLASGRAEFQLPRRAQLPSFVSVRITGDSVFVRAVTLVFAKGSDAEAEDTRNFHRTLPAGETISGIPTTLNGARLISVVITASPGSNAFVSMSNMNSASRPDAAVTPDGSAPKTARRLLPGNIVASAIISPDSDRLELPLGRHYGPVRELVLTVRGAPIRPGEIQVQRFGADTLALDAGGAILAPDSDPLVLRLAEPEIVRAVVLTRRPAADSAPSIVELRAVVSADWFGPLGRNRIENGSWSHLGTATVIASRQNPPNRTDLRLRGPEGKIQRIRFASQREPIRLNTIEFLLPDGRRETLPINAHLRPGQPTEAIKVPPEAADFVALELSPVLPPRTAFDAAIEVWIQY